jgi:hypothetical protein
MAPHPALAGAASGDKLGEVWFSPVSKAASKPAFPQDQALPAGLF